MQQFVKKKIYIDDQNYCNTIIVIKAFTNSLAKSSSFVSSDGCNCTKELLKARTTNTFSFLHYERFINDGIVESFRVRLPSNDGFYCSTSSRHLIGIVGKSHHLMLFHYHLINPIIAVHRERILEPNPATKRNLFQIKIIICVVPPCQLIYDSLINLFLQ